MGESEKLRQIRIHMESYEYDRALDLIETLTDISKDTNEIMNYIGIICIELKEYDIAKQYLQQIREREPDNYDYQFNYAYLCIRRREYEEASGVLEKCRELCIDGQMVKNIEELLDIIRKEEKYKNVLMIAYYYPPLSGSGVFRSLKFTKYLREMKWQPTVIGATQPQNGWNFRDDKLMSQIPDDILVHRIEDEISTGKKKQINGDDLQRVIKFFSSDIFRYDREASSIIDSLLKEEEYMTLFEFPCNCLWWALKTIEYIESNMDITKYEVIYTTSGPASSHLIGLYFKNKYNVTWVADFRDLWIGNPYRDTSMDCMPHMQLVKHLEKTITNRADKVINISQESMEEQMEMYKYAPERGVVITNGYDEEDFSHLTYKDDKNDRFTMVYSGLLYSEERSIEPILKSVKVLIDSNKIHSEEILIRFVGNSTQEHIRLISQYDMKDNVELYNYVDLESSNQVAIDGDMLLCFVGNQDKYKGVYTGKIFNYLRTGVPILALAPKGGVVDRVLEETGQGHTYLSTDIDGISQYIEETYSKWRNSKEKKYYRHDKIVQYERRNLTRHLADVFNESIECKDEEIEGQVYDELYIKGGVDGNYKEKYSQSIYYNVWKEAIKYFVLLNKDTKIIDIGCGVGQFATMLFDYGFQNYEGLDFSKEAIKIAQETNPLQMDKFKVGDAFTDEIFEQEYDVVVMFEILEHLIKDLELLSRVKSGKRVVLSVPNFSDPNHVRYFTNIEKVKARYSKEVEILSTSEHIIHSNFKIFIVVGIKK